jgi:hypothetical protein
VKLTIRGTQRIGIKGKTQTPGKPGATVIVWLKFLSLLANLPYLLITKFPGRLGEKF